MTVPCQACDGTGEGRLCIHRNVHDREVGAWYCYDCKRDIDSLDPLAQPCADCDGRGLVEFGEDSEVRPAPARVP